jgi:hypothetical protein
MTLPPTTALFASLAVYATPTSRPPPPTNFLLGSSLVSSSVTRATTKAIDALISKLVVSSYPATLSSTSMFFPSLLSHTTPMIPLNRLISCLILPLHTPRPLLVLHVHLMQRPLCMPPANPTQPAARQRPRPAVRLQSHPSGPPLHPLGRLRLDRTPLGRLPPRCHQRQLAPFPPTLLSHIFQSMCIVHLLPPTLIPWSLAPNTVSFSP